MNLTMSSILDILNKLYQVFDQRSDLLPGPQKVLSNLSTDFALFLGTFIILKKMSRTMKLSDRNISRFQLPTGRISSRKRSRTN